MMPFAPILPGPAVPEPGAAAILPATGAALAVAGSVLTLSVPTLFGGLVEGQPSSETVSDEESPEVLAEAMAGLMPAVEPPPSSLPLLDPSAEAPGLTEWLKAAAFVADTQVVDIARRGHDIADASLDWRLSLAPAIAPKPAPVPPVPVPLRQAVFEELASLRDVVSSDKRPLQAAAIPVTSVTPVSPAGRGTPIHEPAPATASAGHAWTPDAATPSMAVSVIGAPAGADKAAATGVSTNTAAPEQTLFKLLGERIQVQASQGMQNAVIRLTPHLAGDVRIELRHEAGALQIHIHASQPEVAQQLQAIGDGLRQELASRQFGEVSVQISHGRQGDPSGRGGQAQSGQDDEAARRHEPGRALDADAADQAFAAAWPQLLGDSRT